MPAGYTLPKKLQLEEELVRRRNAEQQRSQLWGGVSNYFHTLDVQSSKFNEWTSDQYYTENEQRLKAAAEREARQRVLDKRRLQLARLLREEASEWEVELSAWQRNQSRSRPASASSSRTHLSDMTLEQLRSTSWELRRKEEEARRREAELKLYHQWRSRQPQIKELERRQETEHVVEAWGEQTEEQKLQAARREAEQLAAMRERARDVKREEEEERLQELARKDRERKLQEELLAEMEMLRRKKEETAALKLEEAETIRQQAEVEALEEKRRKAEERRRQEQLGRYLKHQHRLKLRRMVLRMLEELREDRKLLEEVLAATRLEEEKRREDQARLVKEIRAFLDDLQVREKERQQEALEAERMFDEEARRYWVCREAVWRAESDARALLLADVMITVQKQLEAKLANNLEMQRELLREREQLVKDMERARKQLQREQEDAKRRKEEMRGELDVQVQDRLEQRTAASKAEQAELDKKVAEEAAEQRKLEEELRRMEVIGYHPRDLYRRRRLLW